MQFKMATKMFTIADPSLEVKWWLMLWLACHARSFISTICNLPGSIYYPYFFSPGPAVPSLLKAVMSEETKVTLEWTPPTNVPVEGLKYKVRGS